MNTKGLVPVADLACLMHREPERIEWWIAQKIVSTVVVDGATYVPKAEVDRLRHPVTRCAAEVAAAEAAPGCSVLRPEALALVVRALGQPAGGA